MLAVFTALQVCFGPLYEINIGVVGFICATSLFIMFNSVVVFVPLEDY